MSEIIEQAITKDATGTAAAWTSANPVLLVGETGLETDTGYFKKGDGTTAWNSLSYSVGADTLIGSQAQLCKAWVNFDGTLTGTITPRDGYNVTNITKNATGYYTINFTNDLGNTNYSVVITTSSTGNANATAAIESTAITSSSVGIRTSTSSDGAAVDSSHVCVVINGT